MCVDSVILRASFTQNLIAIGALVVRFKHIAYSELQNGIILKHLRCFLAILQYL